ncbi:hypothetical protein [Streptomyces sp. NPDC001221]
MSDYTDGKGRSAAERVALVQRGGGPVSDDQREAATALLSDLLAAAGKHGVSLSDFDWTADLPGACLDVVRAKARR